MKDNSRYFQKVAIESFLDGRGEEGVEPSFFVEEWNIPESFVKGYLQHLEEGGSLTHIDGVSVHNEDGFYYTEREDEDFSNEEEEEEEEEEETLLSLDSEEEGEEETEESEEE